MVKRILLFVLIAITQTAFADSSRDFSRVDTSEQKSFNNEEKVAVVVGISQYADEDLHLEYADDDAKKLAESLTKLGYRVEVLIDAKATGGEILKAIKNYGQFIDRNKGTFLFAFSGHGFASERTQENYIAPYEVAVEDIDKYGVKLKDVVNELKATGAKRQLLLIDACRDNPKTGSRNVLGGRSFTDFSDTDGHAILFSTKFGGKSWEYSELNHGVFTYYVIEALKDSATSQDGNISFRELASYVRKKVKDYGQAKRKIQVPYVKGEWSGDDFLVASLPATTAIPTPVSVPPSIPPPETEVATWQPIQMRSAAATEDYISESESRGCRKAKGLLNDNVLIDECHKEVRNSGGSIDTIVFEQPEVRNVSAQATGDPVCHCRYRRERYKCYLEVPVICRAEVRGGAILFTRTGQILRFDQILQAANQARRRN